MNEAMLKTILKVAGVNIDPAELIARFSEFKGNAEQFLQGADLRLTALEQRMESIEQSQMTVLAAQNQILQVMTELLDLVKANQSQPVEKE